MNDYAQVISINKVSSYVKYNGNTYQFLIDINFVYALHQILRLIGRPKNINRLFSFIHQSGWAKRLLQRPDNAVYNA